MKKYPHIQFGTIPNFTISEIKDDWAFGYHYKEYMKVPSDGVYEIFVNSNDGGIFEKQNNTLGYQGLKQ